MILVVLAGNPAARSLPSHNAALHPLDLSTTTVSPSPRSALALYLLTHSPCNQAPLSSWCKSRPSPTSPPKQPLTPSAECVNTTPPAPATRVAFVRPSTSSSRAAQTPSRGCSVLRQRWSVTLSIRCLLSSCVMAACWSESFGAGCPWLLDMMVGSAACWVCEVCHADPSPYGCSRNIRVAGLGGSNGRLRWRRGMWISAGKFIHYILVPSLLVEGFHAD